MALAVAAKPRIAAAIFIFGGVGYRADSVWSLANEEIMMVMCLCPRVGHLLLALAKKEEFSRVRVMGTFVVEKVGLPFH